MSNVALRKRISIFLNRTYLYPAPDPLPCGRSFWIATGLVATAFLLFSGFFIYYLTGMHDVYLTHAEDLGIMDQAIWNTVHGQWLRQTICNAINDTNCSGLAGISRFALHVEPILFLVALFYLIVPNPKTLLVLQTLVVASGAFPAFWLARLRLRNEWAGAVIALLYLLYPAQQRATVFDFHAVTFTAALLLFTLYFMYTRRTVWLFVFAILSMACKEEIAGLVVMFGLWSIIFQRRWRSGSLLVLLAFAWTGMSLLVLHLFSPLGHSLLTSRYTYLGSNPFKIALTLLAHPGNTLRNFVLQRDHLLYLRGLLVPAGFLPLLAPWILLLALPTLALNLLSNDPQVYSGLFHYSAEIVPVLIFATIEAIVLAIWLLQLLSFVWQRRVRRLALARLPLAMLPRSWNFQFARLAHVSLLILLLGYVLVSVIRFDYLRDNIMPFSPRFQWPQTNAHLALADRFIAMIPPTASVSAQSNLVPHISERRSIYLFPYADDEADYIFLDVTSNTIYPFFGSPDYIREVKAVILGGHYGVVAAEDGYLLLKRGLPPTTISPYSLTQAASNLDRRFLLPELPASFCSFTQPLVQKVDNPVQVTFSSATTGAPVADLIGFRVDALNPFSVAGGGMTVTTYWRVIAPTEIPLQPIAFVTDRHNQEHLVSFDFPGTYWCQTNAWKPGMVVKLQSRSFGLRQYFSVPTGLVHLSIALVPLTQSFGTIMAVQQRLPLHIVQSSGKISATQGSNGLNLGSLMLVP
ncbi:MAG: DUF2079 domain-containing protein [Ktedonobacteraceae bacterium]|nr:DUF2079 domain-containing protein [Ktedonobacteraceae bacterium]